MLVNDSCNTCYKFFLLLYEESDKKLIFNVVYRWQYHMLKILSKKMMYLLSIFHQDFEIKHLGEDIYILHVE